MSSGTVNEIGVWVSGFYGSGKSSFSKYLAFALDDSKQSNGTPFTDLLSAQFHKKSTQQLLGKLADNFPAAVIPTDLASDQIAGATMEEISTLHSEKFTTALVQQVGRAAPSVPRHRGRLGVPVPTPLGQAAGSTPI